jgi:hypothetical protein
MAGRHRRMTLSPSETFAEALAAGARHYRGLPCKHGHDGVRYTKGRTYVECVRIARGGWLKTRERSAANMVLALEAGSIGRTTYKPNRPCRHGHFERFVASNNCVECDRNTLERQEVKRKFSRIHAEYGLTRDAYLQMVSDQRSACRICNRHEPDHFKLHVDHCHDTGRVRGLLCGPCNQGIGLLRHSPDRLRLAVAYLNEVPR